MSFWRGKNVMVTGGGYEKNRGGSISMCEHGGRISAGCICAHFGRGRLEK